MITGRFFGKLGEKLGLEKHDVRVFLYKPLFKTEYVEFGGEKVPRDVSEKTIKELNSIIRLQKEGPYYVEMLEDLSTQIKNDTSDLFRHLKECIDYRADISEALREAEIKRNRLASLIEKARTILRALYDDFCNVDFEYNEKKFYSELYRVLRGYGEGILNPVNRFLDVRWKVDGIIVRGEEVFGISSRFALESISVSIPGDVKTFVRLLLDDVRREDYSQSTAKSVLEYIIGGAKEFLRETEGILSKLRRAPFLSDRICFNRFRVLVDINKVAKLDLTEFFSGLSVTYSLEQASTWNMTFRNVYLKKDGITRLIVNSPKLEKGESLVSAFLDSVAESRLLGTLVDQKFIRDSKEEFTKKEWFSLSELISPMDFICVVAKQGEQYTSSNLRELLSKNYEIVCWGYISRVDVAYRVGNVDVLTVSGGGPQMLLSASRKIVSPALLQFIVYDIGEVYGADEEVIFTMYQNIFAGKDVVSIIADLLHFVYSIRADIYKVKTEKTVGNKKVSFESVSNADFWFDYVSHYANVRWMRYFLSIPPVLLMHVYREIFQTAIVEPKEVQIEKIEKVANEIKGHLKEGRVPRVSSVEEKLGKFEERPNISPVYIDPDIFGLNLRAYFVDLAASFGVDMLPRLNTPMEIINDLVRTAKLEFFERVPKFFEIPAILRTIPSAIFVLRLPKYDSEAELFSRDFKIVGRAYRFNSARMLSKSTYSFRTDLVKQFPFPYFAFTDGLVLAKFGLRETSTQVNPNARITSSKIVDSKGLRDILFGFARLDLDLNNFSCYTGAIDFVGLPPKFPIGCNFLDEELGCIGYVNSFSLNITGGRAITGSLSLVYVRDVKGRTPFYSIGTVRDVVTVYGFKE